MKFPVWVLVLFLLPFVSASLRDNSQNIDNDVNGATGINSSGWDSGQYFQAQSTYTLDTVSVYQSFIGGGDTASFDYEVDIYRTTADGSPIFLLASNFTYTQTDFFGEGNTFGRWRNISFLPVLIEEGEYYGIFFFEQNTNEGGAITWHHDDYSDTFADGSGVVNTGVGGETNGFWNRTEDTTFTGFYDYSFMTFGEDAEVPSQDGFVCSENIICSLLSAVGNGLGLFLVVISSSLDLFVILIMIAFVGFLIFLIVMQIKVYISR
jgi:hypothetical protein